MLARLALTAARGLFFAQSHQLLRGTPEVASWSAPQKPTPRELTSDTLVCDQLYQG